MFKIWHYLPKTVLIDVYFAVIHSHFSYDIVARGSNVQSLISKLQILQNKAMKIKEGCKWNSKALGR